MFNRNVFPTIYRIIDDILIYCRLKYIKKYKKMFYSKENIIKLVEESTFKESTY